MAADRVAPAGLASGSAVPVRAAGLGLAQRLPGEREERGRPRAAHPEVVHRQADAGGQGPGPAVHLDLGAQTLDDPLGGPVGPGVTGLEEDAELVLAEAGDAVPRAQLPADQRR